MLTETEIRHGLSGAIRTLWFDVKGPDYYPPHWRAAWRSYYTLLFLVPSGLAMAWYANLPYFSQYDVAAAPYLAARLVGGLLGLLLTLGATYMLARSQEAVAPFPSYLAANNWLAVVTTVAFLPFWWLTAAEILPDHTRTTIGICLFVLSLIYSWFIAWRTLKVNPFMACGFAVLGSAIGSTITDIINIQFFGVARPFFDQ